MKEQITEAEAIARCVAGGFLWDDELPDHMRGFGVPPLFRTLMTKVNPSVPDARIGTGDPGDASTSRGLDTATEER